MSLSFESINAGKNEGFNTGLEFEVLRLTYSQGKLLEAGAIKLAQAGGPQARGSARAAATHAELIENSLDTQQRHAADLFANGKLAMLGIKDMLVPDDTPPPDILPPPSKLENDFQCLYLASRNQILLELVRHRAFAFDIDNEGKIIRFVGNFKGGGEIKLPDEDRSQATELSSHAGLLLAPHTEAPYHCSIKALNGHSPAPSALILTARWNPSNEPTCVLPMSAIIEKVGAHAALALTTPSFNYTRSDCFVAGRGEDGVGTSILEFDDNGGFAMRYNSYRFSISSNASAPIRHAFNRLTEEVSNAQIVEFPLQASSALIINNCRALHGRDILKDNRRLLIRLFGYSRFADPIVLNEDPLLVQG